MFRVTVRVTPGARVERVGGSFAPGASPGGVVGRAQLRVSVRERAVDSAANRAVVRAVAGAFGLAHRDVRVSRGRASRTKVLELDIPVQAGEQVLSELLGK